MPRITFLLGLFLTLTLSAAEEEAEYEEDIIVGDPECLQLVNSDRGLGRSSQLKFYNRCPKAVWASICVEERPGKFKLHSGSTRVPKFGYIDIYSYDGSPPVSVSWISGYSMPENPPGQCGVNKS